MNADNIQVAAFRRATLDGAATDDIDVLPFTFPVRWLARPEIRAAVVRLIGGADGTTAVDHGDIGSNQSKIRNVTDSNNLELDARSNLGNLREPDRGGTPAQRPTLPHPALVLHESQSFDYAVPLLANVEYCMIVDICSEGEPTRLVLRAEIGPEKNIAHLRMEMVLRIVAAGPESAERARL
ncbi:MAG: hypothetical protein ACLQIQ_06100 [Beijerinckiaceae bacterium]